MILFPYTTLFRSEDPIGKPIINANTPGTEGVIWIFDPAVLIDDDGEGYLYYGGGVPGGSSPTQEQAKHPKTARVIKLSDDMIHTEGEAQLIDAPFMFEASEIHKHDGKYYYSYRDRKSIRLNSSHVAISYAVFCLKKKKKR